MILNSKKIISNLLKKADIKINGDRDWDIKVYNDKFYFRVLTGGSVALGESYMDGWWDCKRLDLFFYKFLSQGFYEYKNINTFLLNCKSWILNLQSKNRSKEVIRKHYDLDNFLYTNFLDETMSYTCGYWKNAKTLKQSQEDKYDLICKKLKLEKGMKVLDIGCGWGGFAKFAAKKYGCSVIGLTISKEQALFARELCKDLPVKILIKDYRDIKGKFDRVVVIGMIEHVGYRNYKNFFKIVHKSLDDKGLFMLHTIGINKTYVKGDTWVNKYIFPNGVIPSLKQIGSSIEGRFIIEDLHNFGPDYSKTLIEWDKNFVKNWIRLKNRYNRRFYRMWRYYLLSFAGAFKARRLQLWEIVLSKGDIPKIYESIR